MSELESLFSAAVPSSGSVKKSGVNNSVGPKSDKVQLVIYLQFCKVFILIYIIYLYVCDSDRLMQEKKLPRTVLLQFHMFELLCH